MNISTRKLLFIHVHEIVRNKDVGFSHSYIIISVESLIPITIMETLLA